ncbi:hypothetical protein [Rugosimonospora africana]|uniref:Uncharacterized protein n=1 Tax=Rugosimonospora africana TaxID=556532 RepID=A0A8J3QZ42_9ACTN|nr:hypothetical protein [Rugosimonospora africana]GIH20040.1 hypothetical protein Raf01_82120 [Rugosimonospora africana]
MGTKTPNGAGTPSGAGRRNKEADKRARIAAAKAAAARAQRRSQLTRLGIGGGVAAVIIALIAVGVVGLSGGKSASTAAPVIPATPANTATGRDSTPPWAVPADTSAAVQAAGLPMLGAEGTVLHIHAHLDVAVNGQPVTVPAEVGIDDAAQQISPLHTHDTTGVIHIESPTQAQFSLGQFFTEWQVSLSSDHIGALTVDASHQLRAYVNGKAVDGDPAAIVLHAHDEIAVVYGTAAQQQKVPSSYAFAPGL